MGVSEEMLAEAEEARAAGVPVPDLPSGPEDEEVGGFAWEAIYVSHRYHPEPHVSGEDFDDWLETNVLSKIRRLESALDPPYGATRALNDARRVLEDFDRFGMQHGGGWGDEDAGRLLMLRWALSAREAATAQREREDAWAAEQQSKNPAPPGA